MVRKIPPAVAYTASVAFEKGLSIITIPLMALFLKPSDYGRYDVAMSLVEFVLLTLGLGLSHTLIRFASTAKTPEEESRVAAELLGTALILVAILGTIVQLATPSLMQLLKINVELGPLRLLLAAAAVSALIEMPLVWIRLQGEAQLFMYYTMGRAALQAITTWVVLALGYGISGVMIGNSVILLTFAALLVARQWHITGVVFSLRSLRRIRDYGMPLVGAALAMFAIGNANRLFLTGTVSDVEIAHFGIASRLALAAMLFYYPFELWWGPQRIKVLQQPDGLERTVTVWKLGMSIILFSALGVSLVGPLFIALVLPVSYLEAAYLLPLLVLVMVINETALVSNVGCYVKENSVVVLAIDVFAAIIAITGYIYTTPTYGIYAIIFFMALAQTLRLVLYLFYGWRQAPIRYTATNPLIIFVLGAALIYFAPDPSFFVLRTLWSLVSLGIIGTLLYKMDMVQIPSHIQEQLFSMVRRVRKT